MNFPIDCVDRLKILIQSTSDQLIALSDRDFHPEVDSLSTCLNNLSQSIENIDYNRSNSTTSYKFFQGLIKYFEIFIRDFTAQRSASYTQSKKECVIIFQSKLEHFLDSFETVLYFDKNDLFSLPSEHDRWQRLKNFGKIHKYEITEEELKEYKITMKQLMVGQASLINLYQRSGSISKIRFGASVLYYSLFQNSVIKLTQLFQARPQLELLKTIFNLPETDLIGVIFNIFIPNIPVNERFFIPRVTSRIFEPFEHRDIDPDIQHTPADNVSVRLLRSDHRFHNSLIIHIHGGGFISMSSKSHQCYTRKWVKSLGLPCISIDYRLAPEHPFPAALDDVWQVYNWVLRYSESKLNIRPDRIFLVGDTAGGNLALSLTYRVIEENLKPPSGLLLAYPVLSLSERQLSSSMMNSIDDVLVPLSVLKTSARAYLATEIPQDNYFVHPIEAPLKVIERLPPIRIATGDKDPFQDDCWRLTEKLLETGVDVEFDFYERMIHGVLSMCFRAGMKGNQTVTEQFEKWIQELMRRPY